MAETIYVIGGKKTKRAEQTIRLVVRRSRLTDPLQQRLWPDWRYHAFVTNLEMPTEEVDRFHRRHATIELAIRDLKQGAGLEHCPSGRFFANAAWLGCAVLAHNLVRWTARLGDLHPADRLTVMTTIRFQVLAVPGRLVNRAGRPGGSCSVCPELAVVRAVHDRAGAHARFAPRHLRGSLRPAQPQIAKSALPTDRAKSP